MWRAIVDVLTPAPLVDSSTRDAEAAGVDRQLETARHASGEAERRLELLDARARILGEQRRGRA